MGTRAATLASMSLVKLAQATSAHVVVNPNDLQKASLLFDPKLASFAFAECDHHYD